MINTLNKTYWVWVDADKKKSIKSKIDNAMEIYKIKFNKYPKRVLVYKDVDIETIRKELSIDIDTGSSIPENYFWFSEKDYEQL